MIRVPGELVRGSEMSLRGEEVYRLAYRAVSGYGGKKRLRKWSAMGSQTVTKENTCKGRRPTIRDMVAGASVAMPLNCDPSPSRT